MKKTIDAISFLHKGERMVVRSNIVGKFRIPVSTIESGKLKTRMKFLTARQVIEHEIIKDCDPTLYLSDGKRERVFQGGDSSYLPAPIEGLINKHDDACKPKPAKDENKKYSGSKFYGINSSTATSNYENSAFDAYGLWPSEEDYEAD